MKDNITLPFAEIRAWEKAVTGNNQNHFFISPKLEQFEGLWLK